MHVLERALKGLVGMVVALVVMLLALTYGLYFYGSHFLTPDWGPSRARYPDAARHALWHANGGQGAPRIERLSPPLFAWRFYRDVDDFPRKNASLWIVGLVGRYARPSPDVPSMMAFHLSGIAATIRASHWPTDRVLDTYLDVQYFGDDAYGARAGAKHVFRRDLESLDAKQLQVLMVVSDGPGSFNPWCQQDRLRRRVLRMTRLSNQELDAALASIAPMPAGHSCGADSR